MKITAVCTGGVFMIYVMSDIHGKYDKYIQMLKQIHFSEKDTMYILGDMIDRGEKGMELLIDLMERKNVISLMGNHEYMALQCLPWLKTEITDHTVEMLNEEKINGLLLWIYNGGLKSIEGFKLLSEQQQDNVIDYLRKLPLYKELWINEQHYILVHAGLEHFQKEKALSKYSVKELVWARPDKDTVYYEDGTVVIVGHTPTFDFLPEASIATQNSVIFIDCGACFPEGKLACLCLDDMTEYYV